MDWRVLGIALGAAAAGAFGTLVLVEPGGSPGEAVRSGREAQRDPARPAAAGPELAARAAQEPDVKAGAQPPGSGPASTHGPTQAPRPVPDAALKALRDDLAAAHAQVRELTAEVERLRAPLPNAAIVRELSAATVEDLEGLARALRLVAGERLLVPAHAWKERHAAFLARPGTGLARILTRGRFDTLVEPRGGGAYWSFVTRSNSYNEEPDLELQAGWFSSGFSGGNDGRLLDLGDVALEDVRGEARSAPPGLGEVEAGRWHLLFTERPAGTRPSPFLADLPGERRVKAVVGHTYVLRSILEHRHDVLVAFRVLDEDAYGMTLVWHTLARWEVPERTR